MSKRVLIDALYPEEIRVVSCVNNVVEEFDYDTVAKKQLKGNLYLARVTRVEPSLQAAFVEYMNGKHGFLPFAEIHPDYYINLGEEGHESVKDDDNLKKMLEKKVLTSPSLTPEDELPPESIPEIKAHNLVVEQPAPEILDIIGEEVNSEEKVVNSEESEETLLDDEIQEVISEEVEAAVNKKQKIQDVIRKGQVFLVQVMKEERGNKGASLTTYVSLAGRYCVLMPNSIRQGGISRRISNADDRKRIRQVIDSLGLPEGTGVIIRTAGADRSNAEIKRDFEYLVKLWNTLRDNILSSKVPAFIHAEGDVIKRCIRDNYDIIVDEIIVQGEQGYRIARDFMKMFMADHVSKIKQYRGKTPIFVKFGVESQIAELNEPTVYLSSGGYLVINHTEALIAVDVNSGKSTSEKNVEETALKTNLEAAEEIARQMRLRDLSGLIVVDFIDMVEPKNRAAVETILKNALQFDKAKIHLSRISPLGLLEISRQRLRPSLLESNTVVCAHCQGKGRTKAVETMSVNIMRSIEAELAQGDYEDINIYASPDTVIYMLNHYKAETIKLETRLNCKIKFYIDYMMQSEQYSIDKIRRSPLAYFESQNIQSLDYQEVPIDDLDFNFSLDYEDGKQEQHFNSSHNNQRYKKNNKWNKKNNYKKDYNKNNNQQNAQVNTASNAPVATQNVYEVESIHAESHEVVNAPSSEDAELPTNTGKPRDNNYKKMRRNNRNMRRNYKRKPYHENRNNPSHGHEHHESYHDDGNKELVTVDGKKNEGSSLLRDLWKRIID